MLSQLHLAVAGLVFMIAVFVTSFVVLRRSQKTQSKDRSRTGLNPDEYRRLERHIERAAQRADRERREQAARDAEEMARPNQYKEKLRMREEERVERENELTEERRKRELELEKWKNEISKVHEGDEKPLHNISSVEEFTQYIVNRKVVEVESLASTFRLEISEVVARINDLIAQSQLFGVFDDRGRFIQLLDSEVASIQEYVSRLDSRKTLKDICSEIGSIVATEPS